MFKRGLLKQAAAMDILIPSLFLVAALALAAPSADAEVQTGKPPIESMSALTFGPDGWLLVGDSMGGTVYAIDLQDTSPSSNEEPIAVADIEGKAAALLGTSADEIMVHDLAVNPISQNAYLAVSRGGRAKWESKWQLPNDLANASILLRVDPAGEMTAVSLDNVSYSSVALPNPIGMEGEHRWKKGTLLRVDAITGLRYHDGQVYVTGLSNEEFAAAMWRVPFPFSDNATFSTLEIFHGAHGEYETHAPIRAFLPYDVGGTPHILAAYLCTPLVTFPVADLADGKHVKGTTVAEFGSGNYPLDMVVVNSGGKELIVVANSMLPLLTFDPKDVQGAASITRESPTYSEGVPYVARAGSGIQQLSPLNENFILTLQRMPNGNLDMVSQRTARLVL